MTINVRSVLMFLELIHRSRNNRIEGRTRAQKIIYILKEIYNLDFSFSFIPYYYGPYSLELNQTIQKLKELGLIQEQETYTGWHIRYDYELTREGIEFLRRHRDQIDDQTEERITNSLRELEGISLDTLIIAAKSIMSRSQNTNA